MINKCLSDKPVDRPVLAGMVIDPLFREFISLRPFNERTQIKDDNPSCGRYADHDGFLIG